MLDNCFKWIYKKCTNDPCENCIVKAVCLNIESWKRDFCEKEDKYKKGKRKADNIGFNIEVAVIGTIFGLLVLSFFGTFVLGIWKAWELIT
jgi:hypothetical protein